MTNPTPVQLSEEKLAAIIAAYRPAECFASCDEADCPYIHQPSYGEFTADEYAMATELQHSRAAEAVMALPQDVIDLVIEARVVAYEDQSQEALHALDKAVEAFAERVGWDEDPNYQVGDFLPASPSATGVRVRGPGATLMGKEQELRGDAKLVWDAVERHIEASAVDGISAGGEFSRDVQIGQQKYVDGLRVGRLAAINAIGRSSSDEAEVVGWETPAEWDLEQRAFQAANTSDVPEWARETVKDLWRQYCLVASPSGVKAGVTEGMVATAMLDAWNDICSDTGCHPLDIAQLGRGKLAFSPQHWAKSTAMHLTAALGVGDEGMGEAHAFAEFEGVTAKELTATVARYGKALAAIETICLDEDADDQVTHVFELVSAALRPTPPIQGDAK